VAHWGAEYSGEQRELADKYDYWYVPCFFADGVKLHEGASTKEKIRAVLDKCR
jgi:murein tripeptide amidase MpaA